MDNCENDDITLSLLEKRNSKPALSEDKDAWSKERDVFELQLNQLQEQLVAAMVQNQHLEQANKKLKGESNAEQLNAELIEEREEHKLTEDKLQRLLSKWSKSRTTSTSTYDNDYDGLIQESDKPSDGSPNIPSEHEARRKKIKQKFLEFKIVLWNFMHERVSDFINDVDAPVVEEEDEPLSVKRLKENVGRFSDAIQPIKQYYTSLTDLFAWKNIWFTISVFLIYICSFWLEMAIPLSLMLILMQLSINYLHARGIAQKFTIRRPSAQKKEEAKEDTTNANTLSERYQLVLQIARKVQNTLGGLADTLEKIQNLLMWQHEEASKKLFQSILILFFISLILPTQYLLMVTGVFTGFKLFLITPIYNRFPKVQLRYDDIKRLWDDLPTHSQNLQRKIAEFETNEEAKKHSPVTDSPGKSSVASSSSSSSSSTLRPSSSLSPSKSKKDMLKQDDTDTSWESIIFSDRFLIPRNEVPKHDWTEGRRCTLMDKDSPLSSMKHGRLYLTQNYICFERNQFHSKKNVAVKLTDIIGIKKAKPISFMPGAGMAIEIEVQDIAKPYMFAAMMGRDEAFDNIVRAGKVLNLGWSKEH